MAVSDAVDTRKIAFTTSNKSEDFVKLCTGVYLTADADCFVDFDKTAVVNSSFLIKANQFVHMEKVRFTKLNVVGSGSGNLYVAASRVSG